MNLYRTYLREVTQIKKSAILEIGPVRLVSLVNDEVYFLACSFTKKPLPNAEISSYKLLVIQCLALFYTAIFGKKWDLVVTRCLGPSNSSFGFKGLVKFLARFILKNIALILSRGRQSKLYIIDTTDHITIHPADRKLTKKCDLYFKRELAQNGWNSLEQLLPKNSCIGYAQVTQKFIEIKKKLLPISLGISDDELKDTNSNHSKIYDFFYVGESRMIESREQVREALVKLKDEGYKVYIPSKRLTAQEYTEAIQQTWFCPSPIGGGWDCYRHYEIPLNKSIVVLNPPSIDGYHPFLSSEENCVMLDIHDNCYEQLKRLTIMSESDRIKILENGFDHVRKYHTRTAIGKYILSQLSSN